MAVGVAVGGAMDRSHCVSREKVIMELLCKSFSVATRPHDNHHDDHLVWFVVEALSMFGMVLVCV